MLHEIIIARFGGQGVMASGKLLAKAALSEGKNVSWLPSYGPEMRGGTANCNIVISDKPIGNPIISEATAVLALNNPSLDKFEKTVVQGGVLFVNSSLINTKPQRKNINIYYIPANQIANDLKNIRVANMVMLGAYLEITQTVQHRTMEQIIAQTFDDKSIALTKLNKQALAKGADFVRTLKDQ